jgi:hypothetical protein
MGTIKGGGICCIAERLSVTEKELYAVESAENQGIRPLTALTYRKPMHITPRQEVTTQSVAIWTACRLKETKKHV